MKELDRQLTIDRRKLRFYLGWGLLIWTALLSLSLYDTLRQADEEMLSLARKEARANFKKDQAFRAWGTLHGGVYVPVDERTPPSPYLKHVPERDLTTPSGRRLTLMNPAYMLRQMMDEFGQLYGVKGRIVSLKPLNPNNAPDPWERKALLSFEQGNEESFELTTLDDEPYLRLMRPMKTVKGCLYCHEHQGYKVGDIRGGVGVSVPLAPYMAIVEERKLQSWITHGGIWLLGIAGLGAAGHRGRQRIRERHAFQREIWNQANFDPLTRLANRNLFQDRLEQAISHAHRGGDKLVLMFIDLDHFKDVNDTQGHDVGDTLLYQAAERLRANVRDSDTVSRLGGDEFTVLLSETEHPDAAALVARKILNAMTEPFDLQGQHAHVSASIGITVFPDDAEDAGTLMKNADTAMYQAKADGRNTFRYFTWEMTRQARDRVRIEHDLRRAIERDEFELVYQPVFALPDRRLAGAEALLRWHHPEEGLVAPDRFIGIAERSGLIVPIGELVLRKAVAQLTAWRNSGFDIPAVMVNISTRQCRSPRFLPFVQRLARELSPDMVRGLTFEITESLFLGEETGTRALLEELRTLGISLAIDDFGTGYSSLGYLRRFPMDTLKIDRSFIRDLATDRSDATLCEAIISMAHHLGMTVVAEGVETEEQLQILQAQGCDEVQGYLLGRPGPADRLTDRLPAGSGATESTA